MNALRWVIDFNGALVFELSDGLTVFKATIGNDFLGLTNPWGGFVPAPALRAHDRWSRC
jgi:hypothetical protein